MVALLVLPASCNRLSMKKPEEKWRSEEHTSELQSQSNLVCRLLLEKKKKIFYVNSEIYVQATYYNHRIDIKHRFIYLLSHTLGSHIVSLSLSTALHIDIIIVIFQLL